jgi:threonine aldolase
MNFGSDNVYGVHPMILGAINDANAPLTAAAYGHDEGSLDYSVSRSYGII